MYLPMHFYFYIFLSLGIEHDGIGNTCAGSERIMSENAGKSAEAYRWSHCSVDYLQAFLRFIFFKIYLKNTVTEETLVIWSSLLIFTYYLEKTNHNA